MRTAQKTMSFGGDPDVVRAHGRVMRATFYPPILLPVASTRDDTVPGPATSIAVRIYRADATGVLPTVVYFHGGAWTVGDIESHDGHARRIANRVPAVVVNVAYRLAPEDPFPAGYDDCLAATLWSIEHAAELGGDASQVVVAGDSAGGNLAAAVALTCRDRGIPLAAQLLIYPATDLAGQYESHARLGQGEYFIKIAHGGRPNAYVPNAKDLTDPRVSPLRARSFAGVAPLVLGIGEYDPLRDEAIAFAEAVRRAGVAVVVRDYPGLIHGFFGMGSVSEAADHASDELCADLAAALATAPVAASA
jgi:acetyl esterase